MEQCLNDNVKIPDKIMNMSQEERLARIKQLEEIAAKEKNKIEESNRKKVV